MTFKKYAVEDNCWANLASSIDASTTRIRIKNAHNLPQSWERIATLAKKQGDEILKMEKVLVLRREIDLLIVQRWFQSTAQAWEENDVINLYITAEIIREIQRGFDKKADLIDGKVPASQLPEMQAIDESNLVHKSWDEVIRGLKSFNDGIKIDRWNGIKTTDSLGNEVNVYKNSLASPNNHHHILPDIMQSENGGTSIFVWYGGQHKELWLCIGGGWPVLMLKKDKSLHWNNQDWTGEWKEFSPTISGEWGNPWSYTVQKGRYKVIGKTCLGWLKVEGDKGNLIGRPYISLPTASKREWEGIGAQSIIGALGTNTKNTFGYVSIHSGKVEILWWIGHAGNRSQIPQKYWILVKFFYETE